MSTRLALLLGCAWLLTGCAPAAAPVVSTPEPTSLWGIIRTVAVVAQAEAPALRMTADGLALAWADQATLYAQPPGQPATALPLPVISPYALSLLPAAPGTHHLLWLDAWPLPDGSMQNRLLSAYLPADLAIERGAIPASSLPTLRYSALADASGFASVVWSGGVPETPTLYLTSIDPVGRPREPVALGQPGDWPALLRDSSGVLHLFWLRPDGAYHARLSDGLLSRPERVARLPAPLLDVSTPALLLSFSIGQDAQQAYLFWNVMDVEGRVTAWVASGPLADADAWRDPLPLARLPVLADALPTGFNSGTTQPAPREALYGWAAPLTDNGVYATLPVAVAHGFRLVVLYLHGGAVTAYQAVVGLNAPGLIGTPLLVTDLNRHLTLGWSQPPRRDDDDGTAAALRVTTTRR